MKFHKTIPMLGIRNFISICRREELAYPLEPNKQLSKVGGKYLLLRADLQPDQFHI
jgi:hypothetical protein